MNGDLNTSLAVTALYDVFKLRTNDKTKIALVEDFERVLSLGLIEAAKALKDSENKENDSAADDVSPELRAYIEEMIEEISDIKTAVSEAVTNCIVHAYESGIGKIYISAELLEPNILKIKIRDKGRGIENVEKAMEPLFTTIGGERAGLGFAVMMSFMDTVKVRSTLGKGTSITMLKKINRRFSVNG